MTGTVFAVASGKGGVGKTTTAINLGAMLAAADHEVVVVDTDLGMANVGGYLDFEIDGSTLHEVLSGETDLEDAIYRAPGNIDVLPSSTDIHAFAQSQTAQLQTVVADLTDEYEYVLLDTGAGISYDTILPLSLADDVLLVTTPDVAAVRDTAKTGELTARVEGTVRGAVLTQRGNDILNADNVEGTLDTDVLTVVPDDETVPLGIDAGRPLAVFAPNSPPARAYRELANILTGETDTPELSGEPDPDAKSTKASEPGTEAELDPTESETGSKTESPPSEPPADAPESNTDPVHDLIDRRVIKTDDAEGSEPTVEAAPLEAETDTPEGDDANDANDANDVEADDPVVDGSDADDADADTTHDESAENESDGTDGSDHTDETGEFETVLTDDGEAAESTDSDAESSSDLPNEIVEAESNDDVDAVPFRDGPVRPELDDEDDSEDTEETNGLFGRIGSLFR